MLARRKTAEIFEQKMQEQNLHGAVSEYLVAELQARLQPDASAATLRSSSCTPPARTEHADVGNEAARTEHTDQGQEHADEGIQAGNQTVTVRIVLNMHISESGKEGTYERAKFKISLLRELAHASGVKKKFLEVKRISAGSVIVDVDVCADPNLDADSHCPRNVATDLEKQAQDEQSQLRSGTLMARLVSISIVEQCRSEAILHQLLQEQVAPVIATTNAAAESNQRHSTRAPGQSSAKDLARSRSLYLSLLPAIPSLIETNGKSAQRRSKGSQSRTVRISVIQDTEPEPLCLIPNREIIARRLQALREVKKQQEGAINKDSVDSASLLPKIQLVQAPDAHQTVLEGERSAKVRSSAGNNKNMSSAVADTRRLSLDLESQEPHSTLEGSEKMASHSAPKESPSDVTYKLPVPRFLDCVTSEKKVSPSGIKGSPSEKCASLSPTNISLGDRKPLTASDARTPRQHVKDKVVEEGLASRLGVSTNLFEEFDLTGEKWGYMCVWICAVCIGECCLCL